MEAQYALVAQYTPNHASEVQPRHNLSCEPLAIGPHAGADELEWSVKLPANTLERLEVRMVSKLLAPNVFPHLTFDAVLQDLQFLVRKEIERAVRGVGERRRKAATASSQPFGATDL